MEAKKYEAERGRYHVFIAQDTPIIEVRKEDSPFYVKQPIYIETTADLVDLFVAIASVLNQVYDTDDANQYFSKADVEATEETPRK